MEGLTEPRETYKLKKKKEFAKQIRDAKERHWDSQELEEDIWGGAYKIVTKRLNILTPYELNIDRKRHVVKGLFPSTRKEWPDGCTDLNVTEFTVEELKIAAA
ncbi:hypothetical protein QE152_g5981 [Popillia japonica]